MSVSVSRPQITARISDLVKKHIDPNNDPRIYWAKEVTFDYASEHSIRVDFMRYKPVNNSVSGIEKGDFYCYEVKSSEEDFHSKNGHNFIGDFNYYVMPKDVYENVKKLIIGKIKVFHISSPIFLLSLLYHKKHVKSIPTKSRSGSVYRNGFD